MAVEWTCSLYWDCTSKVVGETEEEVVEGAANHAAEHHEMHELDDAVIEQIRGEIVPTPTKIKWTCSLFWDCTSEVVGENEEEVLEGASTHAAEHHDMPDLDDATLDKVKSEMTPA
jgi:predicted small metal-binding protein